MNENGPDNSLTRRTPEAVAPIQQIVSIEKLADEFASICSIKLEEDLEPEELREQLIQKGFPAGLASYLGASLLERIVDARQTLAVAATKPKLKDSLVATVREEIVEYFKSRENEIIRFFDVSADPAGYLKMINSVLSHLDQDAMNQLPDNVVAEMLSNMKSLSKEVTVKILKIAAVKIAEAGIAGLGYLKISDVKIDDRNCQVDINIQSERRSDMADFSRQKDTFLKKNYNSLIGPTAYFQGSGDTNYIYRFSLK